MHTMAEAQPIYSHLYTEAEKKPDVLPNPRAKALIGGLHALGETLQGPAAELVFLAAGVDAYIRARDTLRRAEEGERVQRGDYTYSKTIARRFNAQLRNVIEKTYGCMSLTDITMFAVNAYTEQHPEVLEYDKDGRPSAPISVYTCIREAAKGARTELDTIRLAEHFGFTVRKGTDMDDKKGVDVYINDVPFDLKSSETAADHAADQARKLGFEPPNTLVSPIDDRDYEANGDSSRIDCDDPKYIPFKAYLANRIREYHLGISLSQVPQSA